MSRRSALRLLQAQARGIAASSRADALPAVSETPVAAGGFFSRLFGMPTVKGVPLNEPLHGLQPTPPYNPPASPPTTEVTTLRNGLRIGSEDTPGPTTTLGLFVESGSVYEDPEEAGFSHLLEYMAFKSTVNRTHFRLVREVEGIGAHITASASREQMAYNLDTVRVTVPEGLEVLADSVLNAKFHPWEVKEAVARLTEDLKAAKERAQATLLEGVHSVAYTGALARPLICPESALPLLSADGLAEFVRRNFTADRMVLAGAGIEHGVLTNLATPLLEGAPQGRGVKQPPSTYTGGDFRQYAPGAQTHVMAAFELKGGWQDIDGSVATTVLHFLLGGGGSFSAGGPGKGMHSRLYTNVLNRHHWVANCTSFNSLYNDTGLVGIFATVESRDAGKVMGLLAQELKAVAAKPLPAEEVARAKAAAANSVLMNLESRAVVAEDVGRQLLTFGKRIPPSTFVQKIKAVRPEDLQALAKRLLATPVAVGAQGNVTDIPRYDDLKGLFAA